MTPSSKKNPPQIFSELSSHYGEPTSEIFPRILERLVSRQEAEILLCLPAVAEDVAKKLHIPKGEAGRALEDLFMRGLVVRTPLERGRSGYALTTLLDPILWEIGARKARGEKLSASDLEIVSLFEKHMTRRILEDPPKEPEFRIVPVNISLSPEGEVLPYEQVADLVKEAKIIAVAHCPCRLEQEPRGRMCDYPTETCIQMDELAKMTLERKVSREITVEEALEMLEQFEELGLVHETGNSSYGMAICNCCPCCCDYLRALIHLGAKNATARSRYHAIVDKDLCTGCGACVIRCHFGATKMENEKAHSDPDKCFGCGLCVSKCPPKAIKLVLDKGIEHIPVIEKDKAAGTPGQALPARDILLKRLKEKNRLGAQNPI